MRCALLAVLVMGCAHSDPDTDVDTEVEPEVGTEVDTEVDTEADTGSIDLDGRTETEFREEFVARCQSLWLGVDYTYGGDGSDGIDGAHTVTGTLLDMGYAVPEATSDAIMRADPFAFTQPADATVAQVQARDVSQLQPGDLIGLDYDFDEVVDHVAIYVGGGTALTASDYFDEVVFADITDYNEPLTQDIEWSNVVLRRLDYRAIEPLYGQR